MTTIEELDEQIRETQRAIQNEHARLDQLRLRHSQAEERQQLRRQLEDLRAEHEDFEYSNNSFTNFIADIDNDICGPFLTNGSRNDQYQRPDSDRKFDSAPSDQLISCSRHVQKGEFTWKIEGLSWLNHALMKKGSNALRSVDFSIGNETFRCVYNPTGGAFSNGQHASLSLEHLGQEDLNTHNSPVGITFRYKVSILNANGGFVQWGNNGDECHPYEDTVGMLFGPDTQRNGAQEPLGVFGLSFDELLPSEWVVNDSLSAKFEVEVHPAWFRHTWHEVGRRGRHEIEVPPRALNKTMLSFLDDGRYSDVTCLVDGEEIRCHSLVLAAQSEVFDKELNGGMSESISKVIAIEDCDASAFRSFLRFLYTDDLDCVKQASLQDMLALSHKYQVARLRLHCEHELCEDITTGNVCSVLLQAHLYEARQLEHACLTFIRDNMNLVVIKPDFVSLTREWPDVVLKVNTFSAGRSVSDVANIVESQKTSFQSRASSSEATEEIAPQEAEPTPCVDSLCIVRHSFDASEYEFGYLNLSEGQHVKQYHLDSEGWAFGTRMHVAGEAAVVGHEPSSGWYPVRCVQVLK